VTLGIIIQARMGSTRLPGKVLRRLGDKPLLAHVVDRLAGLETNTTIIVATSTLAADDVIAQWCAARALACFRGSEQDVLGRYMECATHYQLSHVVRLTGDNPFTDTEELDRLIALHCEGGYDYSHSFGQLPIGVGAEMFNIDALMRSHADGHAPHHREHVNEYILAHPHLFRLGILEVPDEKRAPTLRLTVDTAEDFANACAIMAQFSDTQLSTENVISLCFPSA
jgi:spore coat polysaccharide biosynthesis protein SpsF